MRKMKLGTVTLLLGLALFGCTPKTVNTVEIKQDGRLSWIQTDSELSRVATVVNGIKSRADDLLRIQIEIQNTRSSRQVILYRFTWFDKDGNIWNGTMSSWERYYLQGQQAGYLNAIAPHPDIVDCRLEMRRSDE